MDTLKLVLAVVQFIICVGLIVTVIFQPGKSQGVSSVTGSETFFSKNKSKTWESFLRRATTFIAIAFMVISLVLYAI